MMSIYGYVDMYIDAVKYISNEYHLTNSFIVKDVAIADMKDKIPSNAWISIMPNDGDAIKYIYSRNYNKLPWFVTDGHSFSSADENQALVPILQTPEELPVNGNNDKYIEYKNTKYKVKGKLSFINSVNNGYTILKGVKPFNENEYDSIEVSVYRNYNNLGSFVYSDKQEIIPNIEKDYIFLVSLKLIFGFILVASSFYISISLIRINNVTDIVLPIVVCSLCLYSQFLGGVIYRYINFYPLALWSLLCIIYYIYPIVKRVLVNDK